MSKVKYINDRIKKINRMMNELINEQLNVFQKTLIVFDLFISIVIYGSGINDYFQYQFYKRKSIDRKTFIVHRKRMKIVNKFNDPGGKELFDKKSDFNKKYKQFIKRDWLLMTDATMETFLDFIQKHPKFISKVVDGSHGKGISIITIENNTNIKELFDKLRNERVIIEELIVQHNSLAEFNPTSVNTLRVVTLIGVDGQVRVMTANLRMGNGDKYADNFHHNGIASLLDVDTGIVVTSGIDMKFNRYFIHPYTKKQIIGYKIPYWEEIIKTCKEAALVTPSVGYVGWDVAIGENGDIMIIEGNAAADPDISQIPDQIGKWPLYKQFM